MTSSFIAITAGVGTAASVQPDDGSAALVLFGLFILAAFVAMLVIECRG